MPKRNIIIIIIIIIVVVVVVVDDYFFFSPDVTLHSFGKVWSGFCVSITKKTFLPTKKKKQNKKKMIEQQTCDYILLKNHFISLLRNRN